MNLQLAGVSTVCYDLGLGFVVFLGFRVSSLGLRVYVECSNAGSSASSTRNKVCVCVRVGWASRSVCLFTY